MTMRHLTFIIQVWGEVYIGLLVCGKIDLKSYTKCVTISFQHRFDCFVHDALYRTLSEEILHLTLILKKLKEIEVW